MLDLQSHFKSNSSYCCHMHLYIWLMRVSTLFWPAHSNCIHVTTTCFCIHIVVVATLCLAQAFFFMQQHVMTLYPWFLTHKALCLCVLHLSRHAPHWCLIRVSLGAPLGMIFHLWLTKLSHCTRHCALIYATLLMS